MPSRSDERDEDPGHDGERHDRVRPVQGDGRHEGGRSHAFPGHAPERPESGEREPEQEEREPEPKRPAPGVGERVTRMLERLLRRDGVRMIPSTTG